MKKFSNNNVSYNWAWKYIASFDLLHTILISTYARTKRMPGHRRGADNYIQIILRFYHSTIYYIFLYLLQFFLFITNYSIYYQFFCLLPITIYYHLTMLFKEDYCVLLCTEQLRLFIIFKMYFKFWRCIAKFAYSIICRISVDFRKVTYRRLVFI